MPPDATSQPQDNAALDAQPPDPQPGGDADDITPPDLAIAGSTAAATSSMSGLDGGVVYDVIARDGLNLRSGPGADFSVIRCLPVGTRVRILKRQDSWALVDQIGDGAADGFVLTSFLREEQQASSAVSTPGPTPGPSDFKPLDTSTLQTIMNRCAGIKIRSKLDLDQVVYGLNKAMMLANAGSLLREVGFLSQAVIETDYFRTFTEYGRGQGKQYAPYYGRGFFQLTWKPTYAACSQAVFHDDRLVTDPDLVANDIETNIKATAWYWRDYKPFNGLADAQNIDAIIHLLYGGLITSPNPQVRKSVELRRGYYTTIKSLLGSGMN